MVETKHLPQAIKGDQLALLIVGCCFTFSSCLVSFLRCLSLQLRRRFLGWDDVTMYMAFVFSLGFAVASFVSIRWGVGLDIAEPSPLWVENALKAAYAAEIFYVLTIFFVKLSLLILYLRIAPTTQSILYRGIFAMLMLISMNFAPSIILSSAQCIPASKYWRPSVPGHCVDITATFYFNSAFTIITDLIMLALPVSTLWKIQRPRGQRIALLATFMAGGVSTIASCVRLHTVRTYTESHNPLLDAAPLDLWSFIELNLGILCASIPAIKPLFHRKKKTEVCKVSLPYLDKNNRYDANNVFTPNGPPAYRNTGQGRSVLQSCAESTEDLLQKPPRVVQSNRIVRRPSPPVCLRQRMDPEPDTYNAYVRAMADTGSLRSFGSHDIKVTRSVDISNGDRHELQSVQRQPRLHCPRSADRRSWVRYGVSNFSTEEFNFF